MKNVFQILLAATAAAILPCLSWAAGEIISFNINNTTANDEVSGLLSEPALCVANRHWNRLNCPAQGAGPNDISVSGAKDNSGNVTLLSLSGSGAGQWWYDAKAAFGEKGYNYADGPWSLTFTKVPYTRYDVVLYMATDNSNKTWGAVRVGSEASATYYVPGTEDASTAVSEGVSETSTWGQTTPGTHGYGTDVIRIRDLTAQTLELATLKPNNNTRAGLYGFQIVNTGTLRENSVVFDATAQGVATVRLSELGEITDGVDTVEVRLADGATLDVDGAPMLDTLRLVAEGSVTVAASETVLGNVRLVNAQGVTGKATLDYANATENPTLPLLPGVDILRKSGAETWVTTSNAPFNGRRFIAAGGETTLDCDLRSTVATAETPMTVTGAGSLLRLTGNQSYNRVPENGALLAEKGGTLALAGTNPFPDGTAAPLLRIDAATLRAECSAGSHIKVAGVTLANGAQMEITGTANAYASEGLLINTPGTFRAESGANTVGYAEGATENKLFIATGAIEVAEGASLALDVTLGHDIVKVGAGELEIPASRMRAAKIEEGTLAITQLSGDFTPALSGKGTVRLEATGDTALKGTVDSTLSLALEGVHAFSLGTSRPTIASLTEGATLVLEATAAEIVAGQIELPRMEGVTLATANVTVSNVPDATVGEDGAILLPSATPKWTAGTDGNTWSNIERWSNLNGGDIPTAGEVLVDFGPGSEAVTLTVDATVALDTLTVSGAAAGTVALGGDGALTVANTLVLATDLAFPASALPPAAEIAEGKTLTLTGNREALDTTFTGGGNLSFADGTVKLTGSDFSGVAGLTIGAGATLDLNGQTKSHAVILDGGTLANTASGSAAIGPVTLKADSFLHAEGELRLEAPNNARNDLALAGHTLTKTGTALLAVQGADLAAGTLNIREGRLLLNTTGGGDCTLTDTTLHFAKGTAYQAYGWVNLAGTVTMETDAEAEVAFQGLTLAGNGSLRKTGAGVLAVELRSGSYTGTTRVDGGTLAFVCNGNVSKSGAITVAQGATLRKTDANTLTYASSISGAGVCEVAGGKVIVSAANGNFNGTWKVAEGATLSDEGNYNYNPFIGNGAMIVDGTLELKPTNTSSQGDAHINGPLSGSGTVSVLANASIAGAVTLTGTLEIAANVTLKDVTSINGPNVACAGTLAPSSAMVTVAQGKTLSGTGTIQGTVTLETGATLDAAAGAPTVGALALPSGEGVVTLKAAADAPKGTEVLKLTNAVPQLDTGAFAVEGSTWGVAPNADGTALILTFRATLPDGAGTDNGKLTESAATALSAAAERLGVTNVSSVSGRSFGRGLTAAELSGALECFVGEGLISKGEATAEGTPFIVAYDFGISASTHNPDGTFSVTVRVQDAAGGDTVAFAAGTKVELYAPDLPNETLVEPKTIEGTPSVVTFEFPATATAARFSVRPLPFKARVRKE